ncbi:MAG: hypothetical protein M3364_07455, partial [Actinomycetota bacterium]|nr:hypothetical protein [Actinomycetota bacterium]
MQRASLIAALGLALAVAVGLGTGSQATSAIPAGRTGQTGQLEHLLGFVDEKLVRLSPETLQPLAGIPRVEVGTGGCASRSGGTACWANPAWT